jgi:hypothetical protein
MRRALIIGIDDYDSRHSLSTCCKNARRVTELLATLGLEFPGFVDTQHRARMGAKRPCSYSAASVGSATGDYGQRFPSAILKFPS